MQNFNNTTDGNMQNSNIPATPQSIVTEEVKSGGSSKKWVIVLVILIVLISLFIVGVSSGVIKLNNLFNSDNSKLIETVNPTETFIMISLNPSITPNISIKPTLTANMTEYKMTLEYPNTWGFMKQETSPSYPMSYEFFTILNDQVQFTIDIIDGGILDNYCSGTGAILSYTDIVIADRTEKIGKCMQNGVFYKSYSTIDNLRFSILAEKELSTEALNVLKTIKYTGELHNNVK